jgi:hypothetical protein
MRAIIERIRRAGVDEVNRADLEALCDAYEKTKAQLAAEHDARVAAEARAERLYLRLSKLELGGVP